MPDVIADCNTVASSCLLPAASRGICELIFFRPDYFTVLVEAVIAISWGEKLFSFWPRYFVTVEKLTPKQGSDNITNKTWPDKIELELTKLN